MQLTRLFAGDYQVQLVTSTQAKYRAIAFGIWVVSNAVLVTVFSIHGQNALIGMQLFYLVTAALGFVNNLKEHRLTAGWKD